MWPGGVDSPGLRGGETHWGMKKGPVCCGHHPKPPYQVEDTLSALRPNSPRRLWFGLGGLGRRGVGGWALQRREKGECLENERPFGESCVCARTGSVSPTQAGVAGQTRDRCSRLRDSPSTPEQQGLPYE